MRKILVQVKDKGCFYDINHKGQTALGDRPYVLEASSFVNVAVAQNRLEILGEVKESCTDENFFKFYKNENDKKAAVAKYLKGKAAVKIEEDPAKESEGEGGASKEGENNPAKQENK